MNFAMLEGGDRSEVGENCYMYTREKELEHVNAEGKYTIT